MKLLGISLSAILVTAMAWATLWFWGQGLTYKPYDHPLLSWTRDDGQPLLAISTDKFEEASAFLEKNPDALVMLNLKVSQDGQLFTAPKNALDFLYQFSDANTSEYKGNKNFYYDFSFLKNRAPDLIPIETWIALKPRFWIFNIVDNAIDVDKHVTQWIEKNDFSKKVVITSEADIVITSLKNQKPLWIYGTSLSDLTKLMTMASVHLEGLVNFKRDYFITPVTLKNREVLNSKLTLEMKRRFKKVAIGPVRTDQDREKALMLKPDVLILDSSTLHK